MIGYFDASAALKLVVAEAESPALRKYLRDSQDDLELHASWLLFTELHCAARRRPEEVDADAVRFALESVSLTDLEREDPHGGDPGTGSTACLGCHPPGRCPTD